MMVSKAHEATHSVQSTHMCQPKLSFTTPALPWPKQTVRSNTQRHKLAIAAQSVMTRKSSSAASAKAVMVQGLSWNVWKHQSMTFEKQQHLQLEKRNDIVDSAAGDTS